MISPVKTRGIHLYGGLYTMKDSPQNRYYYKHKEELAEKRHQYYLENKERIKQHQHEYYENNKAAYKKRYQKNKDHINERSKQYRKEHPDRIREINKRYREKDADRYNALYQRNKDRIKRDNDISLSMAVNQHKVWSTKEVNHLINLKHQGYATKQIAIMMERSIYSIAAQLARLRKNNLI